MEAAMRRVARIVLVLGCLSHLGPAQDAKTRAEQIQQQRAATFKFPIKPDTDKVEQAIAWANEHRLLTLFSAGWKGFTPTIGGMINGSGVAGGIQFLRPELWGGNLIVRSSARLSTSQYQLYDLEVGLPRLLDEHAYLDFYARHRNYPQDAYYGTGPNSRVTGRSNYRLEDTSYDISTGLRPVRRLRLGIAGGLLQMNVGPGKNTRFISTDRVYDARQTPGGDAQSDFFRGGVLAHVDLRDSAYGP